MIFQNLLVLWLCAVAVTSSIDADNSSITTDISHTLALAVPTLFATLLTLLSRSSEFKKELKNAMEKSHAVEQVSQLTIEILKISSQTNLLSLNANIFKFTNKFIDIC